MSTHHANAITPDQPASAPDEGGGATAPGSISPTSGTVNTHTGSNGPNDALGTLICTVPCDGGTPAVHVQHSRTNPHACITLCPPATLTGGQARVAMEAIPELVEGRLAAGRVQSVMEVFSLMMIALLTGILTIIFWHFVGKGLKWAFFHIRPHYNVVIRPNNSPHDH